jgi:hypothetical protein
VEKKRDRELKCVGRRQIVRLRQYRTVR